MHFYDYYDTMDKTCLTQCVEDGVPLTALEWDKTGKYIAVGDQNGTVKLLELSDSLSQAQYQEKQVMTEKYANIFLARHSLTQKPDATFLV